MTLRERAYLCLKEVIMDGAYVHQSLKKWAHAEGGLALKDRRLLWEMVLGVLRWLRRIDYGLSRQVKRYRKLPEEAKIVLRLGYYQMVILDRIPPYSAVNETVEVAKRHLPVKFHKFTNAVLRKAAKVPYPVAKGDNCVDVASVACSFPEWMVERYRDWWGMDEALSYMRACLVPPPYSLWVNLYHTDLREVRKRLKGEGIECRPLKGMEEEMLEVLTTVDLVDHELYREGFVVPQDAASRLVVKVLSPEPGETVLDACAAPGIKTAQIALAMENSGRVVACEVNPERYRLLLGNCARLGAAIVEAIEGDVIEVVKDFEDASFDRMLLDAPCSDLGTVRRRPEIKWRRSLEDVVAFSEKQKGLLEALVPKLKVGGILVYSVCSLEKEETTDILEYAISRLGLEPVPFGELLPEAFKGAHTSGYAFFKPHLHNTDGFFVAKLRRVR